VILAAPPILTNSYVAVDQVDPDIVDAAKGLGFKPWQVLLQVELPLALPIIFAGIRVAAVFVVATATLKGFFGRGGLGEVIADPASYGISGVVGASYVLIAIALLTQLLFVGLEYAVTPAGARGTGGAANRLRRLRIRRTSIAGATADPDAPESQAEEDQLQQGSLTR
jgi:osmoprotectant transport system permease protein